MGGIRHDKTERREGVGERRGLERGRKRRGK